MRIAIAVLVLACAVASSRNAHAEAKHPVGVFVTMAQVTDRVERAAHIDVIRARLAACAQLANKRVDVNVTRLTWVAVGESVEIQLELAFVMSVGNEIVAIANQTAKLTLDKRQFNVAKLPSLRREVIVDAIGNLVVKLRRITQRAV